MSQSLNTPVIQVDSLKTKFDTAVVSNSLIALLDYDYNQARFLQQLHYWSYSKYGVIIDGIRWIYKSAKEWLSEALVGLTEWKLRQAIASLLEKNLIRREKLFARHQEQEYSRFWWQPKNQTYYYSINYDELQKLIEKAQLLSEQSLAKQDAGATRRTTEAGLALAPFGDASFPAENVRFEESTKLSVEEIELTKVCELSRNSTKNTNHKKKTSKQSAAASPLDTSKEEETALSSVPPDNAKSVDSPNRETSRQSKTTAVDEKVNLKWKAQVKDLDDVGIRANSTLISLIKSYPFEEVENAIALVRARKREQHVPNPAGYFTRALEENWAGESVVSDDPGIDTASVFRHWYDLAKKLGYCQGQEVRDGEQWVCLSGRWERWKGAVERGYSLDYLKKILRRNEGK